VGRLPENDPATPPALGITMQTALSRPRVHRRSGRLVRRVNIKTQRAVISRKQSGGFVTAVAPRATLGTRPVGDTASKRRVELDLSRASRRTHPARQIRNPEPPDAPLWRCRRSLSLATSQPRDQRCCCQHVGAPHPFLHAADATTAIIRVPLVLGPTSGLAEGSRTTIWRRSDQEPLRRPSDSRAAQHLLG
jgi:hypothetical protein